MQHTPRTSPDMDNASGYVVAQLPVLVASHTVEPHVVVVVVNRPRVRPPVLPLLLLLLPLLLFRHLRTCCLQSGRNTKILPLRKISARLLPLCM